MMLICWIFAKSTIFATEVIKKNPSYSCFKEHLKSLFLIYFTNINFKLMDEKKAMIRDLIFKHKKWRQTKEKLKFNLFYRISIKFFPFSSFQTTSINFISHSSYFSIIDKNWVAQKKKSRAIRKKRKR